MRRNHLFVFIMVRLAGCAQMQSPPGSTQTVRGPNDPRLGRIDAILVSHVHGDHLGDLKAAKMPVHVPLSGRTMQFDGSGRCVSGC